MIKIEYILDAPAQGARPASRLRFEPVSSNASREAFRAAVRSIVSGSLDRADQLAVRSDNADVQANRLAEPDDAFAFQLEWWALAYDAEGHMVGITQPVVFAGCERDGLREGTIHYIGVLPEYRGRRYIHDLLRFATWTLAEIGVWRIYADTDELNVPMRQAFLAAGYREGRSREVPSARQVSD